MTIQKIEFQYSTSDKDIPINEDHLYLGPTDLDDLKFYLRRMSRPYTVVKARVIESRKVKTGYCIFVSE